MNISTTLDLGDMLTLIGMLIVLITFGNSLKSSVQHVEARVKHIESKVDKVENRLETINLVLIELAKYEGRLALIEQKVSFAIALRENANSNNSIPYKHPAEGR